MHKTYEMDGEFIEPLTAKEVAFELLHRATETTTDDLGWRSFASQKFVMELKEDLQDERADNKMLRAMIKELKKG